MSEPDPCSRCPHPFGPHEFVAIAGDPLKGGIILCPVPGCRCFGTWSTSVHPGADEVVIPSEEEIEWLRELLQWQVRDG